MAEAFLQVLIHKLSSVIEGEIGLIMGVDKEMKKLSNTLTTIHKVLEDAEDKQFQSKAVRNWLAKLNDIAYEIEDVLDECATQVSKLKLKDVNKFNYLNKILYTYKIGRRMKEVAEKLDSIAAERQNFDLHETVVMPQSRKIDWRRETGSVINEPDHIHGRDQDRDTIVDVLVNQVVDCHQLSVLPIIGVGGLGKTTLAQLVYNDERVSRHFDTKLWICVSDDFDLKAILKAIIESATGSCPSLVNLDSLQRRLRQELNQKRYLLILDDVWNDNQEDWAKLKSILACGTKGSSIVVTTRLKKVVDVMGTLPTYCLKELSEEHCWLLFRLRAFGQEENEQHRKLETIGRQIVKKCAGVPLAAKALGGLLRFNREENEWIRVSESEIWNIPETSILPILRLSYHHLPSVLKRCFVYCAVFPKDSQIEKQDLIFRWMAHGCISSDGREEVEDVGNQIWNELVLRSFFQQVEIRGTQTIFKMHDLVHDLAQSIMENKIPGAETSSSRASASNSKIREVHLIGHYQATHSSSISLQLSTLTTIMKYSRLRILKLNKAEVEELPCAIGQLKYLRCLDLSCSSIRILPRTFCDLRNLQILILNYCSGLKSLPKNIRYMTNLRHVFLRGCYSLRHMPPRIGKLTSLKTLSVFIVGDKIGNQLDELEHLNLGGIVEIRHLERVQNHVNAKKANLVEKHNLRELVLYWEGDSSSTLSELAKNDEVLKALEPHPNLETLEIYRFKGSQLPLWMTKMENMTWISIQDCPNCAYLLPLANLPCLKYLGLSNLGALEYIINNGRKDEIQFQNSEIFPALIHLVLYDLPNLKGLFKEEVGELVTFPSLRSINIIGCQLLILPLLSIFKNLSTVVLRIDGVCNITHEDAFEGLCSVRKLTVWSAREHRLPEKWFKGLKSLAKLELELCKIGSCFPEGWLGGLTALEKLRIDHCWESVGLAKENIKDLHLLKEVDIGYVEDMVSLPQGLQHIHSLQSLTLRYLPELTSMPDWLGNLTSLTKLQIGYCPKVPSLPSSIKGMTNLRFLNIYGCPQLERRCEKDEGEDWHKIAHIPNVDTC